MDDDVDVLSEGNTVLAEIEVLFCETAVVIAPIGDCGDSPGRAGAGGLYADDGGPYECTYGSYAERCMAFRPLVNACGGGAVAYIEGALQMAGKTFSIQLTIHFANNNNHLQFI